MAEGALARGNAFANHGEAAIGVYGNLSVGGNDDGVIFFGIETVVHIHDVVLTLGSLHNVVLNFLVSGDFRINSGVELEAVADVFKDVLRCVEADFFHRHVSRLRNDASRNLHTRNN